jgi:hypothetical protein
MLALGDSKSAFLISLVISTCAKCFAHAYASSWAPAAAGAWPRPLFPVPLRRPCPAAAPQTVVCSAQWEAIGGGKAGTAVCKRVLEKGWGKMTQQGVDVEVEYVGTLGERDWSVGDVLECWLQVRGLGTGSKQEGDWVLGQNKREMDTNRNCVHLPLSEPHTYIARSPDMPYQRQGMQLADFQSNMGVCAGAAGHGGICGRLCGSESGWHQAALCLH